MSRALAALLDLPKLQPCEGQTLLLQFPCGFRPEKQCVLCGNVTVLKTVEASPHRSPHPNIPSKALATPFLPRRSPGHHLLKHILCWPSRTGVCLSTAHTPAIIELRESAHQGTCGNFWAHWRLSHRALRASGGQDLLQCPGYLMMKNNGSTLQR